MSNDLIIDRLVADLRPVRRRRLSKDALVLGALCLAELATFLALGFMRPDMAEAMAQPSFWWKLVSTGLIAVAGGAVALASFDPVRPAHRGLRLLLLLSAVCVAGGWVTDAGGGWLTLASRIDVPDGLQCVLSMGLLSMPPLIGLGLLMRRGAPTSVGPTASAVGIASAAWGAFVFVFACPSDDPFYITVWYVVGCGLVTALARLLLPRLTRW